MKYKNYIVGITGGAGLIGSYLTELLLQDYSKIVVIDDFSTGLKDNIVHINDKIELRIGDLENLDFVKVL